jgi:nucleotide-binding universal stress UspA family protein
VILAAVELPARSTDSLDTSVLTLAGALAAAEGAQLLVVHAWSLIGEPIVSCPIRGVGPSRARQLLMGVRHEHEARMEALLVEAGAPSDAHWRVIHGSRTDVVETTLERTHADVLVMGYRSRGGFWGALHGNLAEGFLGRPELSVLAVRPGVWAGAEAPLAAAHHP